MTTRSIGALIAALFFGGFQNADCPNDKCISGLTPRQIFYGAATAASRTPAANGQRGGARAGARGNTTPAQGARAGAATTSGSQAPSTGGAAPQQTATTGATQPTANLEQPRSDQARVTNVSFTDSPLVLRYAVLTPGSLGQDQEVDVSRTFHSGDRIRVSIESSEEAYLYIVQKGSSGKWSPLFPESDSQNGGNRIPAHSRVQIPPPPATPWKFDNSTGEESLFVVLTRQPEPDLQRLIYSLRGGSTPSDPTTPTAPAAPSRTGTESIRQVVQLIDDDVIGRVRQLNGRDLVVESVNDETSTKKEKAVFVADRSGSGRLTADIKLKHQ
jgi:hypothetical protein